MTEVREVTSLVVCESSHSEGTDVFCVTLLSCQCQVIFFRLIDDDLKID